MTDHGAIEPLRNTPMTLRRLAVAATFVLVLSACSGDDDASSSTTLVPPPTAAATSTTVPSTEPETTPPPTDPVPETAPPTTSAEPTTTTSSAPPDEAQIKQAVIDAAIASWTAFNGLLLEPNGDASLAAIAVTFTDVALDRVIDLAFRLRTEGRRSLTNPDLPAMITPYPETVVVDTDSGRATVDYCRLGSNISVEIEGNDDGTDRVLDDTINSYLERDEFVLVDGVWLKSDGQTVEKFEGASTCVAA